MQWQLLNQFYVSTDYRNSEICVLEEVISSALQLVALLVSGTVSSRTMNSVSQTHCNQIGLTEEFRL